MYYSSLSSTSHELANGRNHPKSRSQLHHHHHHHPSSSSSLSAFSQQPLPHPHHHRASAFLIDEYGNQHDPEHCRFKTLAPTTHHDSSASTPNSSRRSSLSSVSTPSTDQHHDHFHTHPSWPPCSPSSTSSLHSLPRLAAASPPARTSCWAMLKPRHQQHPKPSATPSPTLTTSSSRHSRSSWSRSLWAHLSRPAAAAAAPVAVENHPNTLANSLSSHAPNPVHLSAIRKHVELVKLEVRFGILRTRKRVLGAWKQRSNCKKP